MPDREPVDRLYNPDVSDHDIPRARAGLRRPRRLVGEVERHTAWAAWIDGTPFGVDGELNEVGFEVVSLMLRGSVRAALCGVFDHGPETADIRCYADGERAFMMGSLPGRTAIHLADFEELPEMLVAELPEAPFGASPRAIWLSVDDDGLVRDGQDDDVGAIASCSAARARVRRCWTCSRSAVCARSSRTTGSSWWTPTWAASRWPPSIAATVAVSWS